MIEEEMILTEKVDYVKIMDKQKHLNFKLLDFEKGTAKYVTRGSEKEILMVLKQYDIPYLSIIPGKKDKGLNYVIIPKSDKDLEKFKLDTLHEDKENEILVPGIGKYDFDSLSKNINKKAIDLAKRAKKKDFIGPGTGYLKAFVAMWEALSKYQTDQFHFIKYQNEN